MLAPSANRQSPDVTADTAIDHLYKYASVVEMFCLSSDEADSPFPSATPPEMVQAPALVVQAVPGGSAEEKSAFAIVTVW